MGRHRFAGRILHDARDVYPETPSDKVMGTIFINLGLRLAACLAIILLARWMIFLPRMSVAGQVVWGILLLYALVYAGYFLYSFNQYLQENMRKVMERRKAELKKKELEAKKAAAKSAPRKGTSHD